MLYAIILNITDKNNYDSFDDCRVQGPDVLITLCVEAANEKCARTDAMRSHLPQCVAYFTRCRWYSHIMLSMNWDNTDILNRDNSNLSGHCKYGAPLSDCDLETWYMQSADIRVVKMPIGETVVTFEQQTW